MAVSIIFSSSSTSSPLRITNRFTHYNCLHGFDVHHRFVRVFIQQVGLELPEGKSVRKSGQAIER